MYSQKIHPCCLFPILTSIFSLNYVFFFFSNFFSSFYVVYLSWKTEPAVQLALCWYVFIAALRGLGLNLVLLHFVNVCCSYQRGAEREGDQLLDVTHSFLRVRLEVREGNTIWWRVLCIIWGEWNGDWHLYILFLELCPESNQFSCVTFSEMPVANIVVLPPLKL